MDKKLIGGGIAIATVAVAIAAYQPQKETSSETSENTVPQAIAWTAEEQIVADKVKQITAEQLRLSKEEVIEDANFYRDLGADSLDAVELVMALEQEFDLEIPDMIAEQLLTVRDAIKHIAASTKVKANSAP